MPPTTPDAPQDEPTAAEQAEEARRFYENLEQAGELVDVEAHTDLSALPPRVTHVRYPDGTVKRIRFTGSPYR
jgi:allantoicase